MNPYDEHQQEIVRLNGHSALVLAPPGAGKTYILAGRVVYAAVELNVPFQDMLCLTFTNRAAREMRDRITESFGHTPEGLFIGNIHRFCLSFLYENKLISADTAILDEDDQAEFLAKLDITTARSNYDFMCKVAYTYQIRNDHPPYVVRHPPTPITERDTELIDKYQKFKSDNNLVDFDDLLLLTYTALMSASFRDYAMTGYKWVQVDEVQDLTTLQLDIIQRLANPIRSTIVYLGDEQQAIYNFLGAGGPALDRLKFHCRGNIHYLHRNYRSNQRIVKMCNDIAYHWLNMHPSRLPEPVSSEDIPDAITYFRTSADVMPYAAASIADRWSRDYPDQRISVLVRTNREGDSLSAFFESQGIEHFHISSHDTFHSASYKNIFAHLKAVACPSDTQAWARLLFATKSVRTLEQARKLTASLRANAFDCRQLFDIDTPGPVEDYVDAIESETRPVVVFDTETTGLNIFSDDIIQIAAFKMLGGQIIEESNFEVFLETDKPIPTVLGDGTPNPLVEIYNRSNRRPRHMALKMFADYISGCTLCGHNVGFDIAILLSNMERAGIEARGDLVRRRGIDTLDVARLLYPRLLSHDLGTMLDHLDIEGINSHIASDDALATLYLAQSMLPRARKKLPVLMRIRTEPALRRMAERFADRYLLFYDKWHQMMYRSDDSPENKLTEAIYDAEIFFRNNFSAAPLNHMEYVIQLIEKALLKPTERTFREQTEAHLNEMRTLNESDLFANDVAREKISIMTVHKSKGLEADNVLIYFPNGTRSFGNDNERVVYVAFSRARKRLALISSQDFHSALPAAAAKHFTVVEV